MPAALAVRLPPRPIRLPADEIGVLVAGRLLSLEEWIERRPDPRQS